MTKRKNYDAALEGVGSSDVLETSSTPPQKQLQKKKKKPKTIKVETEVEEIIAVDDGLEADKNMTELLNINDEGDGVTVAVQKKRKKLRRVDFDAVDENELLGPTIHGTRSIAENPTILTNKAAAIAVVTATSNVFEEVCPSTLRLTEHGGYLHTKQSRMKISQANQGKSPWNKGKERTDTAKARISAGVRARNNELLQTKLQILQITEDEWFKKKRQIKLLRERVRKAKLSARNYLLEQQQLKELQAQLQIEANTTPDKEQGQPQLVDIEKCTTSSDHVGETNTLETCHIQNVDIPQDNTIDPKDLLQQQDQLVPSQQQQPQEVAVIDHDPRTSCKFRNIPMFQRDIEWTPHRLDEDKYDAICPTNGPGGLICCQYCMGQYTQYMSYTITELQRQTTVKIGNEVDELYHHVQDTKQQLQQTIKVTRRKPIPIRQQSFKTTTIKKVPGNKPATPIVQTNGKGNKNNSSNDTVGPAKSKSPVTIPKTTATLPIPDISNSVPLSDELFELSNEVTIELSNEPTLTEYSFLDQATALQMPSEVFEI